jgi:uncharacterized membrane protein
MNPYLVEWLNLVVRWVHVIAGFMWIGSSIFFNWLDSHFEEPEVRKPGVEGELWMVHGGGFYQVEKKLVAPDRLPRRLHWFKWEAGFTWMSGFLLLGIVYYLGGGAFLVDPSVSSISPGWAIAIGVGTLVVGWAIYDLIWISPLAEPSREKYAIAICVALLLGVTYGLSHVLSGRAAYLHVGALLGTLMAANVWMRIIPSQRELVNATKEGRKPDASFAKKAKKRSRHNNYMTYPVIFIMLSNHYPSTYGHAWNWAILAGLMLLGGLVRHYLNTGDRSPKILLGGVGAAAALAVAFAVAGSGTPGAPAPGHADAAVTDTIRFSSAQAVINQRCVTCHAAEPADKTFGASPGGVAFDTPERIRALAERIKYRAVTTRTMPFGNKTGMTDPERELLGRWIDQGAPLE